MTQWQPPKREPAKTKAELREMLAEAVRNTEAENKRLQTGQERSRETSRDVRYVVAIGGKADSARTSSNRRE